MPRLPVDNVQEFRVTLGQYERERLDTIITALTINKIGSPVIALLSDVSAMTLITSAYITFQYGPEIASLLSNDYESTKGLLDDVNALTANNNPLLEKAGFWGDIFQFIGNLQGEIIGSPSEGLV